MPNIVIIGSCRNVPFNVVAPYSVTVVDERQEYAYSLVGTNQEKSYMEAKKVFHPAIEKADVVIVWLPNGIRKIGEHTKRNLMYAESLKKRIIVITSDDCYCLRTIV